MESCPAVLERFIIFTTGVFLVNNDEKKKNGIKSMDKETVKNTIL